MYTLRPTCVKKRKRIKIIVKEEEVMIEWESKNKDKNYK